MPADHADKAHSLRRIMVEIDQALDRRSKVLFISGCHRRREILAWCAAEAETVHPRMVTR